MPHVRQRVQHRDWAPSRYLGLAYLAAAARRAGIGVAVIDARGEGLGPRDVAERVRVMGPRLVGFTAMTHELGRAAELAGAVRDLVPSVTTLVGGAHTTALPLETLSDFPVFDVAARGESEAVLPELFEALEAGRSPADVAGIAWRSPDGPVLNPERPAITDLDALAFPAWDLFPATTSHFPVYTARGCPYQCNFCMRAMGSSYRYRSVDSVIAELEELAGRHGARSVTFEDETFMIRRDRTHALLEALIATGLHRRLPWMANLHARTVDDDLARRMRAAGCWSVGTGVESGSPRVLAEAGKGLTVDVARRSVATLKRHGLAVRAFFIFGHPRETLAEAVQTVRLAAELDPDHASFGIMVPYPGTEVARLAAAGEGGYRILSLDWSRYDKYLGHALELEHLPRWKLELLQMVAYLWLHLRNGRIADLATFVLRHHRAGLALARKLVRTLVTRVTPTRVAPARLT